MRKWKNRYDEGIYLDKYTIFNSLLYADDLVLIAETENKLQKGTYQLQNICTEYDMKISTQKTKTMAFVGADTIRSKIVINDEVIEQIRHFKYLGCDLTYDFSIDVEQKLNKFSRVCGTISRHLKHKTRKDTQLKFYKTIAVPTLTYGSEIWTTTRKQESRIQAQEMKFLRRVKGCTKRDRFRNTDIRHELNVNSINDVIKEYRKNWKEHLDRMDDNRLPRKAMKYKCKGRRSVGRPRKRWVP